MSVRPRNALACPYCGEMIVLHTRLPKGLSIPCRSCGRSFQARTMPKAEPRRTRRRVVISGVAVGLGVALAVAFGLTGRVASNVGRMPTHQWEVESHRQGRQAVFSLYGSDPDRIEYVLAATREGAQASEGGWTRWKGEARTIRTADAPGGLTVKIEREGESWEICLGFGPRPRASVCRRGVEGNRVYEGTSHRVP